jgi:ADP-heptose:LPS heptosyltransferase
MAEAAGFGSNLLQRLTPAPRKIAVLRASRLGDFICTTPALRALRAAAPDAEISVITLPLLEDMVVRSPHVDRFIAFPGFPGMAEQLFSARTAVAFLQRMQAERFDLTIQLQGSGVYANPVSLMFGARATAGFIRPEDSPGRLDAALVWQDSGHEIERMLALVQHLGAPARGEAPVFSLLPEDIRGATALVGAWPPPLIGIHTGSHDPSRRWPSTRFVTLARLLLSQHGGTVLLFGTEPEADAVRQLADAIGPGAHSLAGRTPLALLGAVIARLALLVTNDTGPAHIGYALATPTVAIYRHGGTRRYGPLTAGPFRPLEPECADTLVSIDAAVAVADELLTFTPRPHPEHREWHYRHRPPSTKSQ